MNATDWLYALLLVAGIFALGWLTRGLHDATPRVEFRRVEANIRPAATYFECPVTKQKVAEWYQACKGRRRSESIKFKGD